MTDLPYPIDDGRTHWEGCYRERRHHNCAVAEVDRLRVENERLRAALEAIAVCAVCDGWCGSCAMGHELAFYNTGEEGVARFAREALDPQEVEP